MKFLGAFVTFAMLTVSSASVGTEGQVNAIANMAGSGGQVHGNVTFTQKIYGGNVTIQVYLVGLSPGKHGFHVHEKGNIGNDCQDAGEHYNPYNLDHGGPNDKIRHLGDLGNVEADNDGIASLTLTDKVLSLVGPRSIIGRAIVVHEDEDDLGRGDAADSRTAGHSGSRAGCGVIGIN